MRIVLFDLGNTLESDDALLPGAKETLEAIRDLRDCHGDPAVLALVSNYFPASTPEESEALRQQYFGVLTKLGLRPYFEPLTRHVTLSTEVGVEKPDPKIFRAAIDKISPGAHFHQVFFVTEDLPHVKKARELGMMAVHFRGPGQTKGDVKKLLDLAPLVKQWIAFDPCGKQSAEAVGRVASQANKSKQANPKIQALLAKVDVDSLRNTVAALAGFGTRWTYSPTIGQVPKWIHGEFLARGYTAAETRFQKFPVPGKPPQQNVLCGAPDTQKGFVLVCCHYDTISEKPAQAAPGADDDASGVAVVLELARILHDVPLKRELLFAAFGGEEQGLFGSTACAKIASQKKWAIDVVINLDMVSYKSASAPPKIIVEYDQGNRDPGNDAAAKAYGLMMAQAAADYTSLQTEHTDIWNSDYLPFEARGYACIGAYNAEDNPFYHRSTDTVGTIDFAHLAEVVKMTLATIVMIAG